MIYICISLFLLALTLILLKKLKISKKKIILIIVLWNIDPKDWLVKDSKKVYNSVLKHACDGCIVLMHDLYPTTIEAVKMLIPKLNNMGYEIVSISDLLKYKNYNLKNGEIIRKIK